MNKSGNIRILLSGADGRMGTMIREEINKLSNIVLGMGIEREGYPSCKEKEIVGCDNFAISHLDKLGSVMIDFSTPEAAIGLLRRFRLPSVIGVTGFTNDQLAEIKEISKTVPIVQDYNFSTGVCIMTVAAEMIAQKLGVGYDAEILEIHHGGKVDAPSGTAIKLAEAVAKGREQNCGEVVRMSREGKTGARPVGEIGIQALRLAGVVGEHTVYFGGPHERLGIFHIANSRAVFAQGAVRSAQWVVNQPPGFYTYRDVLGL